jgi:hypothetical protein
MSKEKREAAPTGTRGRVLLVAIALLFVAGLVWFWSRTGERHAERGLASGTPAPPLEPRETSELAPPAPRAPEAVPATTREGELAPFASARTSPQRFEGKLGSLRGHIEVSGEQDFPQEWQLVLHPSTTLPGREHAVARTVEFSDGRQDFEVADVPLGGYDVSGRAARFNGPSQLVLLEPGNEHPYVNLVIVPAGLLEGRILDARGLPAEGVPVTLLASETIAGEASTDASGIFRFESLPDGAYELLVGKVSAPLMPERHPVRFMAPHLTFPDIELPLLGEIHVRVVDSYARPLEGVEVRGSGTHGGLVEGRTDFDGRLVAKYLPAGHFRLRLEHPAFAKEYARRVAVDVEAGKIVDAPVRLGP